MSTEVIFHIVRRYTGGNITREVQKEPMPDKQPAWTNPDSANQVPSPEAAPNQPSSRDLGKFVVGSSNQITTAGHSQLLEPSVDELVADYTDRFLPHGGNAFIETDLRRLKRISSLATDIDWARQDIFCMLIELGWPKVDVWADIARSLVARIKIDSQPFNCYKTRISTTRPQLSPSQGCRLIYGLGAKQPLFLPLLVYRAAEEGQPLRTNKDRSPITRSNLSRIVQTRVDKAGPDFRLACA